MKKVKESTFKIQSGGFGLCEFDKAISLFFSLSVCNKSVCSRRRLANSTELTTATVIVMLPVAAQSPILNSQFSLFGHHHLIL